jgi:hypothetical protein
VGPPLLIPIALGGPTRINIHWDWVGPLVLLVPIGLGGPTTINIKSDWLGPAELFVSFGLGGPATMIAMALGAPARLHIH